MADMKKKNLPVKCISVNLSRVHVKSQRIAERLDKIARQYAITPSDIAVEVTESAISENAKNVCGLVNELHRHRGISPIILPMCSHFITRRCSLFYDCFIQYQLPFAYDCRPRIA